MFLFSKVKSFGKKKSYLLLLFCGYLVLFPILINAQPSQPEEIFQVCKVSWLDIPGALRCIGQYLITLFFRIPVFLFAMFGILASLLLIGIGWILVPSIVNFLISLSLNTEFYNLLSEQWGIIRNLALSLVILFLLIIGLATILGRTEYHARKTLVRLVIIVLLVSFSLTICQKIIEIGNSLTLYIADLLKVGPTDFFSIKFDDKSIDIRNIYENLWNALVSHFGNIANIFLIDGDLLAFFTEQESATGVKGPILFLIGLIALSYWIFAFIVAYVDIVLIVFGIAFFVRTAYLIALIFVSPIAFLTAALPTQEIRSVFPGFLNWDNWKKEFLEWVFMGVPLIIWLLIALVLMGGIQSAVSQLQQSAISNQIGTGIVAGVQSSETNPESKLREETNFTFSQLITFMPVIAAAVALHIGVKTSHSMIKGMVEGITRGIGAMVTSAAVITGAALTAGAGAAAAGFAAARAGGAGILSALRSGLKEGVTTFGKATLRRGLTEITKPIPAEIKEAAKAISWVRRLDAGLISEKDQAEKYAEELYKAEGAKGLEREILRTSTPRIVKEALLRKYLKEEKTLSDAIIDNPEIQKLLMRKENENLQKAVLKVRPDLAPVFRKTLQDAMAGMKPTDIVKIHPKALEKRAVFMKLGAAGLRAIIRGGTEKQKSAIRENYAKLVETLSIRYLGAPIRLDYSSSGALKNDFFRNRRQIMALINTLRNPPPGLPARRQAVLQALADELEEIGIAIFQRRL